MNYSKDGARIMRKKKKRSLKELCGMCKGNEEDGKFDVVKEHDLIVCDFYRINSK